MSRRFALAMATFAVILAASCEREARRFRDTAAQPVAADAVKLTGLQPGTPEVAGDERSPFQDNAYGIAEGKRLFAAFNCNGCHANGGGGIGPALMDDVWIYGYRPQQIYSSVLQGRPNGMPAFSGRIPDQQAWQLVAYIQSLSAATPRDAATSRSDNLAVGRPENRLERLSPKQTGHR